MVDMNWMCEDPAWTDPEYYEEREESYELSLDEADKQWQKIKEEKELEKTDLTDMVGYANSLLANHLFI